MAQVININYLYKINFSCLKDFVVTVCFASPKYIKASPLVSKSNGLFSNNHVSHVPIHP